MPNTDKWLAIEDYNDMVAEQLQQKIAEDLYLFESMNCFKKYKSYTNTNNIPTFCRDLS